MRPISREAILERRQPGMRWSAVIAGAVLSLGLWILLQTVGMGLGLSAVDTNDASSLRAVGIGTGIWSLIAPLIAMFFGGMLAGRLAGTREARVGAMHGAVHWALTAVIGTYLVVSLVSALASGVTRAGSSMISAGSSMADRHGAGMMDTLGVNTNELLGPVNQKLRAQGKPEITAEQVERSVRAAAQRGLAEGRIDRDMLADELARNTALTRADVDDLAQQVQARVTPMMEKAKTTALEAADKTGKALLMAGIGLLLGLCAAAGGGALGARMAAKHTTPVVVDSTITDRHIEG